MTELIYSRVQVIMCMYKYPRHVAMRVINLPKSEVLLENKSEN